MAENSPFLNPKENPSLTGAVAPTGKSTAPASSFSIRPASSPAPSPPRGTTPPSSSVPSSTKTVQPQVIPGPAIGEAPQPPSRPTTFLDEEKAKARKKRLWWVVSILLLSGLIGGGIYWWWQTPAAPTETGPQSTPASPSSAPTPTVTEEVPPVVLEDTANYRSENFKAGDIIFLGEAQFLQVDEGIAPLSLENIRGEAFTEKNKKEVKLVITWKTNKLSSAEISYAKGIGQTPKMVTEDDLAYNHSVILTGLDPASTYLYTVKATDRFGGVVTSEPYAVFTGARSVSLFDLIAGAIGDVFGWAVK